MVLHKVLPDEIVQFGVVFRVFFRCWVTPFSQDLVSQIDTMEKFPNKACFYYNLRDAQPGKIVQRQMPTTKVKIKPRFLKRKWI